VPIIETKNLKKVYSEGDTKTFALQNTSFSVEDGEFVAVMGPSGSGKSTLLHILGFLDEQTSGKYLFEGKSFSDHSEEEIAHIRNAEMGFIFQSFNLLPRINVLENTKLPLIYSNVPESKWDNMAREAIESVGLTHRIDHEPSQLSGGEKQRAAIARALINKPKIIFADEPTGNLDSKSGKMIMEIIEKLNEDEGHTIILITHETYTAEHAQRIIRLHDGEIISDKKVRHRHSARKEEFKK